MNAPEPEPRFVNSWRDAEVNACAWMKHWGFVDAQVTAPGADSGIDVVSSEALAQVKYEAHQIGRPALQRLVGARTLEQRKKLLFFTGSAYAAPAVAYANTMGIALFTYALDGRMTAVNDPARALVEAAVTRHRRNASSHGEASHYRAPPVDPVARRREIAKVKLAIGSIILVWLLFSLMNETNYNESDDIVPMIVLGGGSLLAGGALLRSGVKDLSRRR